MKDRGWYGVMLTVLAPLLLLGAGVVFILLPWVLAERRALDEERGRFFAVAEEIRGLASLRQRLSQISFNEFAALFIPKDRPLAFIEALETLALRNSMSIEIVSLDESSLRSSTRAEKQRTATPDEEEDAKADDQKKDAVSRQAPETEKLPAFEERGFEVRLKGPFEGAMRFLAALERQPVLLRVDTVTIQALREKGDATLNVTTVIRFYAPTLE